MAKTKKLTEEKQITLVVEHLQAVLANGALDENEKQAYEKGVDVLERHVRQMDSQVRHEEHMAQIGAVITRHFVPAKDVGDATMPMTTSLLFQRFEEHEPGLFTLLEMVEVLRYLKCKEDTTGPQPMWLLKVA